MDQWKLRISDERAKTLLNLFRELKENGDMFLNTDLFGPIQRHEIIETMNWFGEAWDNRQARVIIRQRWENE